MERYADMRLVLQCDFVIRGWVGLAWWLPGGVLTDRAEDIGEPDQVVAHGPVRVCDEVGASP